MPLSTLRLTPRGATRKTQGQDGVALSFPAGILPPLQHAGLTRRTPGGDSNCDSRRGECDLSASLMKYFVVFSFRGLSSHRVRRGPWHNVDCRLASDTDAKPVPAELQKSSI